MKKNVVFITTIFLVVAFSLTILAQDDVYTNENAPANYDANLRSGEKAIGASRGDLEIVTILSKSGGIYKTTFDDGTSNTYLFRANAVYPYFNLREFGNIIYGKEDLITPYLECYAKKHGRDFEKLKGDGFRPPYYGDINQMQTRLQNGQAKLAEIESRMKNLVARPDTFLAYDKNPAVWYEIAVNRVEYLPCALGERQTQDVKDSPWLRAHRDGIKKVLGYVEYYRVGSGDSMGTESEYALYAVSPKLRMEWLKEKDALAFKDEVDKLLKPLSDALSEKLPTYQPRMTKYPFGTAADFALMKKVLSNQARYKIYKIGLMQNTWQIDKNVLGIPNARYKNGVIHLRDTQADHPYCYATHINIIQDYSGGGTYAGSRAKFISDEVVGCPAVN